MDDATLKKLLETLPEQNKSQTSADAPLTPEQLAALQSTDNSSSNIPMQRPLDNTNPISTLMNGLPGQNAPTQIANQISDSDLSALKSNNKTLGLPDVTIPYRNEDISGVGITNNKQPPKDVAEESNADENAEPDSTAGMLTKLKSIGIGSPTNSSTPPTAPTAPIAAPAQVRDAEYEKAQKDTNFNRMLASIMQGANKIGSSVAGLGAGAMIGNDHAEEDKQNFENANNPITDLTAKRKAATDMLALQDQKDKNDPNSDVSKAMRDAMKQSGMNVADTATYGSMEKMFPVLMHHQDMQAKIAEMLQAKQLGMAQIMSNKQVASSAKASEQQSKAFDKTHAMLEQMRGNPAVQQAERDLYATDKINTLVAPYRGNLDNISQQMVNLLKTELTKVASGQGSTEAAFGHLDEGTLKSKFAEVYQKFANEPTGANAGAFLKQYLNYSNGLAKDAQKTISDRYGRILEPAKAHLNPDDYKTLDATYTNRFNTGEATPQAQTSKGTVSQSTVQDYAVKHNMDVGAATDLLTKSGYVIK